MTTDKTKTKIPDAFLENQRQFGGIIMLLALLIRQLIVGAACLQGHDGVVLRCRTTLGEFSNN